MNSGEPDIFGVRPLQFRQQVNCTCAQVRRRSFMLQLLVVAFLSVIFDFFLVTFCFWVMTKSANRDGHPTPHLVHKVVGATERSTWDFCLTTTFEIWLLNDLPSQLNVIFFWNFAGRLPRVPRQRTGFEYGARQSDVRGRIHVRSRKRGRWDVYWGMRASRGTIRKLS